MNNSFQVTCLFTFGVRMDSFSLEEKHPQSKTSKLIRSAETTNRSILPLDQGFQLWRKFETPTYKRLRIAQTFVESVAINLIYEKISYYRDTISSDGVKKETYSLIDRYLKNPKLDLSDIIGIANDLLLAGIDTTSYTTSFILYYLAKNPDVQKKIFEESKKVLNDKNDPLEADALAADIPYTKAVLKEVFRLNPVSVGVGRVLNKDTVFSSYQVPKGVSYYYGLSFSVYKNT